MTRRSASIVAVLFLAACGPPLPPRQAETPPKPGTAPTAEAPPKAETPPKPEVPPPVASAPSHARPAAAPTKQAPAPRGSAPVATAKPAPSPPPVKPQAPEAARPTAQPLDLASLEARLKQTSAIGVLTKLSLKNQVDDLVDRCLAFHAGKRPPTTLSELRPSYELLLMKVLSLLQDKDTSLAQDINASREAIWSLLTDGQKLARYK